MSPHGEVWIAQVLEFDEEEFTRFMATNRDDHGNYLGDKILDCHTASLNLKQKLWARICAAAPKIWDSSRIDLDDLTARLQLVSDAKLPPTVSESPTGLQSNRQQTLTPPSGFVTRKNLEIHSYHELLRLGGRPVCSLADFEKAYEEPLRHAEILTPWLNVLETLGLQSDMIRAFTTQLERWKQFQAWQLEVRGLRGTTNDSNSSRFEDFLEERRRLFHAIGEHNIADGPNFEASVRRQWQQLQDVCQIKSRMSSGKKANGNSKSIRERIAATKRRLKAAGFNSSRAFKFHNDPKKQDKRTTWIEYLRFECWYQDTRMNNNNTPGLHEVNDTVELDLETGQTSVPGDSKTTGSLRGRTDAIDFQAQLHKSHGGVWQSQVEAKGQKAMASARLAGKSPPRKRDEQAHELQQRRLEWIVGQVVSMEMSTPATLGPKSTAKRKREDEEEEVEDGRAAHTGDSLMNKRATRGKRTRLQAPRPKDVNLETGSRQRASSATEKHSRMTLGLIYLAQQTRTTSKEGHRRSVRLQVRVPTSRYAFHDGHDNSDQHRS